VIDVGFRDRVFLRKQPDRDYPAYHLHVVRLRDWPDKNERLLRDYLIAHRQAAEAYGHLKSALAVKFAADSPAYTAAKTAFIQQSVDAARTALGLPLVNVWQ
jgi:GrpB-like predicted nucleotidyltransferase (UPF0157 family)